MSRTINKLYSAAGVEQTPTAGVYTLSDATVYYAEFATVELGKTFSAHWKYNNALVATITIEASNRKADEVTAYDSTGWATTSATAVSPAASASETVAHYADFAAARARAKIDVMTGGTLRCDEAGKAG